MTTEVKKPTQTQQLTTAFVEAQWSKAMKYIPFAKHAKENPAFDLKAVWMDGLKAGAKLSKLLADEVEKLPRAETAQPKSPAEDSKYARGLIEIEKAAEAGDAARLDEIEGGVEACRRGGLIDEPQERTMRRKLAAARRRLEQEANGEAQAQ